MTDQTQGTIVTFYSFKGGTGRTAALANTAWILASAGYRVLVVDWDLESPGLHRFFEPFLDTETVAGNSGVIDMIKDYQWAVSRDPEQGRDEERLRTHARVGPHVVSLDWEFPDGGELDIVSAGRQNRNYSANLASLDWDNFYDRLGGGQFFRAMREDMRSEYDYTLIDSRTGFSDVSAICTVDLPDVLVTCFTLSNQGIDGAANVAAEIGTRTSNRVIRILPVPSRIDEGEKEKADVGRRLARSRFAALPTGMSAAELTEYWGSVEIPYRPFYAYEEILAAFGDAPGVTSSLLSAFERLVGYITDGAVTSYPAVPEPERLRVLAAFTRKQVADPTGVVLSFVPKDRMWADWIEATLESAGVPVRRFDPTANAEPLDQEQVLVVGSTAYTQSATYGALTTAVSGDFPSGAENRLSVVNVADSRLGGHFATTHIVDVNGLSEPKAVEALLRVVQMPGATVRPGTGRSGPRFPGNVPMVFVVPQRNPNFTGRDAALDELHRRFGSNAASDSLRVALYGLGGVGKTQVALEYSYRFRANYDLVWWVNAERDETVIESLAELAVRLGIPVGDSSAAAADNAVQDLRRRGPDFRWLLVFDNADDPDVLEQFLPQGATGHTLVTSRNWDWGTIAKGLEVKIFEREESQELLTRRVGGLSREDAGRVAEALGDLPLAVEVAAAWLSVTGTPVDDYLALLDAETSVALSVGRPPGYTSPVERTWNVSLDRLQHRSPAAVRMLQLCAFMAPSISLSLIRSRQMVEVLRAHDPTLREQLAVGRVLQEIGRLALARVDWREDRIDIHRLVQAVIRDQMPFEAQEEAKHAVHRILAAMWPDDPDTDDPGNWARYARIWPHLEPSTALDCVEEPVRQLLIQRVRYLYRIGEFKAALATAAPLEERWRHAIETDEGAADLEPEEVMSRRLQLLSLRYEIANIRRSDGEHEEAHEIDQAVLEEQTALLGPNDPRTLMTARSLAADLRGLSRYADALDMDRVTYEKFREELGDQHDGTLMAANNLAISYRLMGDCFRARDIDERTHEIRKQLLGENHPHTLISAGHLARDLREAGEFERSVVQLEAAFRSFQELGSTLPEALRIAKSLAVSLRRAGRIDDARTLTEQTYALYPEESEARKTPDAYACLLNHAADLSVHDDKDKAVEETRAALVGFVDKYGEDHPYTLMCLSNLSMYERGVRRYEEAARLARQAYDGLVAKLGPTHPYPLCAALNLANALADLERFDGALALESRALDGLSARLGAHHVDALIAESNLSITLRSLGRVEEANERRARVAAAIEEKLGTAHPNSVAVRRGRRINRDLEPQPI